jgi:hypothetical protein
MEPVKSNPEEVEDISIWDNLLFLFTSEGWLDFPEEDCTITSPLT